MKDTITVIMAHISLHYVFNVNVGANCVRPRLSEIYCDRRVQPRLSEIHHDRCVQPTVPDNGGIRLILSDIGKIIQKEIDILSNTYDNVIVDKYVIMPDHIHMIILIISNDEYTQNIVNTVSQIIKQFKGSITKKIGFSLWQKSFYDRIIRDNLEYQHILKYINENPVKWAKN